MMGFKDWFKKSEPEPVIKTVVKRHYIAAKQTRLASGWSSQPMTSAQMIETNLNALKARSQEQYCNNDYAKRFISMVASNVVGPKGFKLQSIPKDSNGSIDRRAAEAIEAAYEDWGRMGNCDATETLCRRDIEKLFITTVAIDGEFLALKITGKSAGKYGYRLQLLETSLLNPAYKDDLSNGNTIRMGIEFNPTGKPIAYHIRQPSEAEDSYFYQGGHYKRIPADKIIHRFIPEFVGQKRGVPWMSTALLRMKLLDGYEEAAVTAARVGAAKMGFLTSPAGAEYIGDEEDDEGEIISDAEAGVIEQLPEGFQFQAFNPDYPHAQFKDFMKTALRGISSGLGVAYNSLANDLEGVNYSSIRSGVVEDREVWKAIQEWMIEVFLRPVFLEWLEYALLSGAIVLNTGRPLPVLKYEKYSRVNFAGRRWDWVDPAKDTKANNDQNDRNSKSVSEIIRERGRDPEEVFQEIAQENERMKELGITRNEVVNNGPIAEDQE